MRLLIFGDIFAKPGRKAVQAALQDLKATYQPDLILGNVENLSGGKGVSRKTFNEMRELGFDGLTGGNHSWDNKEVFQFIDSEPSLFRPANFPGTEKNPCPGRGYGIIKKGSHSLFVINLLGRVFMDAVDCPFTTVDKILAEVPPHIPVWVDMHADATSEKYAMAWHLDGRVAALTGTHSHVQTADERVLPKGTAYITDIGMTGSFDSVIGLARDKTVKSFVTKRKQGFEVSLDNPGIGCVIIDIDFKGKATKIERLRYTVDIGTTGLGGQD